LHIKRGLILIIIIIIIYMGHVFLKGSKGSVFPLIKFENLFSGKALKFIENYIGNL